MLSHPLPSLAPGMVVVFVFLCPPFPLLPLAMVAVFYPCKSSCFGRCPFLFWTQYYAAKTFFPIIFEYRHWCLVPILPLQSFLTDLVLTCCLFFFAPQPLCPVSQSKPQSQEHLTSSKMDHRVRNATSTSPDVVDVWHLYQKNISSVVFIEACI